MEGTILGREEVDNGEIGQVLTGHDQVLNRPPSDSLSCLKACAHKHTHSHLDTCSQYRPVLKAKGGR